MNKSQSHSNPFAHVGPAMRNLMDRRHPQASGNMNANELLKSAMHAAGKTRPRQRGH